ncbi:hypothetical protein B0G57_13230 [Trinickia symbiotica]|nr:hypothetical protein B0G57_13230 [Trinickia symbiotica]
MDESAPVMRQPLPQNCVASWTTSDIDKSTSCQQLTQRATIEQYPLNPLQLMGETREVGVKTPFIRRRHRTLSYKCA